ncbi:ubiquitinyl hydrolase 1 [Didymosphaeria variabile]|uniref:Ubiquitin carboxyl-terminal hydrolase n=1 Tax=Didymosphaeria variabile TaxID=1932322 RepID=A0A9W9C5V1_9PLEO|nr:ubiquitinyl hydrolase 1 [Didymosphaeria variabile]KAJ4345439.1 ubiquitinyl hydrolase 1 [Didymosphaeria variabile]
MTARPYTKHFIPLESNPEIFTQFIHALGVSPVLRFEDVLALDEPSLLPHPALALILTYPTPIDYEERRAAEEAAAQKEERSRDRQDVDVVWFKQTINNACGFYAILHAISNGEGRHFIRPNSVLANLLEGCQTLAPEECAERLEASQEIERIYSQAARMGESEISENPEDEVDFHFVCFVKDGSGREILELDGDRMGPVRRGQLAASDEDLLGETGRRIMKQYFKSEGDGGNVAFNLMALIAVES